MQVFAPAIFLVWAIERAQGEGGVDGVNELLTLDSVNYLVSAIEGLAAYCGVKTMRGRSKVGKAGKPTS